jgi:LPXTG-motif cell wall-anchored protein
MAGRLVFWALLGLCGAFALRGALPELPLSGAAPTSSMGWIGGLLLGLAGSWLYRIEWAVLLERLGLWAKVQRRRLAWIVVGSICAAILICF